MAFQYNFTLTNSTPLTTVYALEGNGTGNLSVPRQILNIDFGASPVITVADNVTTRFVAGFVFTITGGSPYDGSYTVSSNSTSQVLPSGQVVTHIPLATAPLMAPFTIVHVVTGSGGQWVITGPANGSTQFYPTSTFTVAANSLPAADGPYVVASSITGNEFQVSSVTTGAGGKFVFAGDVSLFFTIGTTFKAVHTGGFDSVYTVSTITVVGATTEVVVVETIPAGTTVTIDTLVLPVSPNTVITVVGIIPAGAGADGTAQAAAAANYNFANISPITITPTTPQHYTVTFNIIGNYASQFTLNSAFLPRNITYNTLPYTNAFIVSSSTYVALTNTTSIAVDITDTGTMPVIAVQDTSGHQYVNFSSLTSGSDATNLVPATTYTATIAIDGTSYPISVLGSTAQTFTTLVSALNTQLAGNGSVTLDIANTRLIVASATTGSLSSVLITAGTLFAAPLANFTTISGAVAGTNASWITFPIPAIPYGNIQYTVPTISSSLKLVGPGSSLYNDTTTWGKALQDNLIHLSEHFANTTAPATPLVGQFWYNTTAHSVNVWDTTPTASWRPMAHMVAAAPVASTDPGNPGDWFADDTFFYTYGATGWRRVGITSF